MADVFTMLAALKYDDDDDDDNGSNKKKKAKIGYERRRNRGKKNHIFADNNRIFHYTNNSEYVRFIYLFIYLFIHFLLLLFFSSSS